MSSASDLQKQYKLPLLPGNTCGEELLRRNYRRAQILTAKEGSPTANRAISPRVTSVPSATTRDFDSSAVSKTAAVGAAGAAAASAASASQTATNYGAGDGVTARVLRFHAYYSESVTESSREAWRVRKVTILLYLDDMTLSVSEKKEDNSGILPQGIILKRHQVQDARTGGLVGPESLRVGGTVKFYGREYFIVDADAFTRNWYETQLGEPQGPPAEYPVDAFEAKKRVGALPKPYIESVVSRSTASGMKVMLSPQEVRATQQFLSHDREVLRCDCVWDDRDHLYGELRRFHLYYFLADDTIEIVEAYGSNSGRDPFPVFCRRQKCSKPRTVGGKQQHSNYLLGENNAATSFYTDADIKIGARVNIFGRTFLICAYNKYTAEHLEKFHGVFDHTPLVVEEEKPKPVARVPPPYNGFGDERDSLSSWRSLDLKPPRPDNAGRRKFGDDVIKFRCKLAKPSACDANRRFVLTFYLADGQLAIFEPPQRNSGIVGGKFLQKCKTRKADGSAFSPKDFFLGAQFTVNGFTFDIIESDERTLGTMEKYADAGVFPQARATLAATRLASMLKSASNDLADCMLHAAASEAPTREGLAAMAKACQLPLSEHEIATIFRFFEKHFEQGFSYADIVGLLVDGSEPRGDARDWKDIEAETLSREATSLQSVAEADRGAEAANSAALAQRAAAAAAVFNEAYNQRRRLFEQEFRQICDYSKDSKIGAPEFARVVNEKLGLTNVDTEALGAKLFPKAQPRTHIEEFMRLLHDTSTFSHTLKQLERGPQ